MSLFCNSAKSIFLEAIENCPPERWDAFLNDACGVDGDLRRRVRELLDAHREADSRLDLPDPAATAVLEASLVEAPGTVIGPYRVLELIGEGGMGVVYVAEQSHPVRRRVALKIIKPGMDTKQVIARFEAERQVLAMMDHPNIAKVFDGGTTPPVSPPCEGSAVRVWDSHDDREKISQVIS
jgi:serine/threonine-protein kinase